MHVLYFHQHFSTPSGTTGTRSYEMAKALLNKGHSVTMVCGSYAQGNTGLTGRFHRGKRRGIIDGIDVIEFEIDYANHMGFTKRLIVFAKFVLKGIKVAMLEPADIMFATSTPLTSGIPALFARWLRFKPFIFEVRDLWPELPKAMGIIKNPFVLWLMSLLELISYKSAHSLIGLSPGIVKGIKARGIDKSKISMIPNGCDIHLFSNAKILPWRPKEIPDDQMLAIFTGTHGVANGLDSILEAAALLKLRGRNDISIALIGEGKEKARLLKIVRLKKLNNVIMLDSIPKKHLVGLMKSADIGLQVLANIPAFYYGTSPNKFFDYISSGLPVLNNYPGWIGDIIRENDCGFEVNPDDTDEFANLLEYAADDRKMLKNKAYNAYTVAKRDYNRKELAHNWVNVLETCYIDTKGANNV